MRTTYSISFYCRRSKADRQGQAPLEISLIINGQRRFINCPLKCSPEEFNRKRRPQYLQDYIDTQRVRVATIVTEMATNAIPLTTDSLREYIRSGGVKSYTVEALFNDYFGLLKKRVGKTITKTVYEKYERVMTLFYEHFDKTKEVTNITPAVIQDFYAELQSRYKDSTSGGMMTKLKSVIRYAMDNNKLQVNPFQNIRISKGTTEITTISNSQLKTIINHKFTPRVQRVADMFIFSCGSGLAYADLRNLKKEDFVEKDGKLCIFKERQKTGVKFYSVLLPWAVDIYNKYGGEFPVVSNQKTNAYLQEIEDICGIDLHLHFHLARHFYAMYLLNKKVPITSVQKAVGHSNISMTQHYAKALATTVIDDISSIF